MMRLLVAVVSVLAMLPCVAAADDTAYVIPDEAVVERIPYQDSNGTDLVGFLATPEGVDSVPALIFIQYVPVYGTAMGLLVAIVH